MRAKTVLLVVSFLAAALLAFAVAAQADPPQPVDIPLVAVGNPGNAADTRYDPSGYGAVDYNYSIGKFEVTAGQYTEFLNAVGKNDPYGLYSGGMPSGSGIMRSVSPSGYYSYDLVAPDWANRPVNYVTFRDAQRFANWRHNSYVAGFKLEGILTGNQLLDKWLTEDGAYDQTSFWYLRKANAKYFIPSENEWYKAAYHKNDGVTGNYWGYPTDPLDPPLPEPPIPGRDLTETTNPGDNANYYWGPGPYPIDPPYYTTKVGEFELSHSAYGTFDQGGNVWEWTDFNPNFGFAVRGGSYADQPGLMHANYRSGRYGDDEGGTLGFRVGSSVPEPGSIAMLLGVAVTALLYWWRRHAWPFL